MKRYAVAILLLILSGLVMVHSSSAKDSNTGRLLTGRVVDHQDQPLASAVVYLSNTHTKAIKTFIVGPDGTYRFPALSQNIDYEVYAQHQGHKSNTKTVSQFDNRQQVTINLKI